MAVAHLDLPALDLRQLHHFLSLVEHGSISAAAAGLGVSQPSLSEFLSRLECKLQTKLVVRRVRGIQLTEAGVLLAHHARSVIEQSVAVMARIRELDQVTSGMVSIGLPPTLSQFVTVPLAETVHIEFPAVQLRVTAMLSGSIEEEVENGVFDFGCVFKYRQPANSNLRYRPLLTEALYLVSASDNWPGEARPRPDGTGEIRAAALAGLPLVLPSRGNGPRDMVEQAIGHPLNVIMEIDSLQQAIEIVNRASAYSIMPATAVIDQVQLGKLALIAVTEASIARTAYVVRGRARPLAKASVAVEGVLGAVLRESTARFHLQDCVQLLEDLPPAL